MKDAGKPLTIEPGQIEKAQDNNPPIVRLKNNMYAGIKVSLRTMDAIILTIVILLVLSIIAGIILGN